jgi:hypothetical protein
MSKSADFEGIVADKQVYGSSWWEQNKKKNII